MNYLNSLIASFNLSPLKNFKSSLLSHTMDPGTKSVLTALSHQSVASGIHRNMCLGGKMSHSTNAQLDSHTQSTKKMWKSE